jgi:hypothetical protein
MARHSTVGAILLFILAPGAVADPPVILSGGGSTATGGSITARLTLGQPIVGVTQSSTVTVKLGFWHAAGTGGGGCTADFNNSGAVSVQDIFDFLAAYFSPGLAADFNHSGEVSVQDIFDFLAAYFTPC